MKDNLLLWIGGFCVTSGGALIATVWAMLNAKIDGHRRETEILRERIADLYAKLEKARERSDDHRYEMAKMVYEVKKNG